MSDEINPRTSLSDVFNHKNKYARLCARSQPPGLSLEPQARKSKIRHIVSRLIMRQ